MDESRRDFFKQIGGKDSLRKAAGLVARGLQGFLAETKRTDGTVEDAGKALRTRKKDRPRNFDQDLSVIRGDHDDISTTPSSESASL